MSDKSNCPIFPLRTILFPDSRLPLRIFEPRYIDMVSKCMKDSSEFGVVLSRESNDPKMFETYNMGTMAKIIDWEQGNDGLLGISTIGTNKFKLLGMNKQDDGLNIGNVEIFEREGDFKPTENFSNLVSLLKAILDDINLYNDDEKKFESASWVSFRFAEILPLKLEDKQRCLEIDDPIIRLNYLEPLIRMIRENSQQ
ncbi:MAG: peptidase S16 [Dehalococcoidia bacterium]|nr:peptidase S16 [Dehalococcoidia bacterium]